MVIGGVESKISIVISHFSGLTTPLTTTHELLFLSVRCCKYRKIHSQNPTRIIKGPTL